MFQVVQLSKIETNNQDFLQHQHKWRWKFHPLLIYSFYPEQHEISPQFALQKKDRKYDLSFLRIRKREATSG